MPQLSSDQAEDKIYRVDGSFSQRKTFRERLIDRFAAHEWVRVINIDDEDYYWQYLPSHNETFDFTPDGLQKIVNREPVEAWMLEPGHSEVIIGENAYLMIEGLYKKLVAKGYLKKNGPIPERNPGRNFNWSDSKQQEDLIEKIYLGKETPEFKKPSTRTPIHEVPRLTTPSGRLTATK